MIVVSAASSTTSAMPAGSVLPIAVVAVDQDLDVQAVVAQQHWRRRVGLAVVADELRRARARPVRAAVRERDDERAARRRA